MKTQQIPPYRGRLKTVALTIAAATLAAGSVPGRMAAQSTSTPTASEGKPVIHETKFFCNIKALDPAARAHHKQLTDKLMANRTEIVESATGYEFRFAPSNMTIAELGDWSVAESKCCPFFDFHIDLEEEGRLLCLRLTGAEGVKAFLRSEFQLPAK